MSETNNETAVLSRTTSTTSPSKAKLTPLVPGKEDLNRPLVELTHVEKHFGALHVLKDINLTVAKGEKVTIPGWIAFERVETSARTGRNPQTGAEIKIPDGKRVKVTAGSKLKAAVK